MSTNPYQSSELNSEQASTLDPRLREVLRKIAPPARGLLLLHGFIGVVCLVMAVVGTVIDMSYVDPAQRTTSRLLQSFYGASPFVVLGGWSLMLAWGAWKFLRLSSRRWALAGALLASVPQPLMLVSLPLGIWSLALLWRNDVKAAFGLMDSHRRTLESR